jgi:hypothetical protein
MTAQEARQVVNDFEAAGFSSFAIAAARLDRDGLRIERAGDLAMPAASLVKLFVLGVVAEQLATGAFRPDSIVVVESSVSGSGLLKYCGERPTLTVEDLLVLMLNFSDNRATNALLSLVSHSQVDAFLKTIGAVNTSITVAMMPKGGTLAQSVNQTTAADVLRFYTLVVNGFPAQLHSDTALICRRYLYQTGGHLNSLVSYFFSRTNALLLARLVVHSPMHLVHYCYALGSPLRRRLARGIPTSTLLAQKPATDKQLFHDSCLLAVKGHLIGIVLLTRRDDVNYYRKESGAFQLAGSFAKSLGQAIYALAIQEKSAPSKALDRP